MTRTVFNGLRGFIAFILLSGCSICAHAQITTFTYQGRLNDGPNLASGDFSFVFRLVQVNNGVQQGPWLTNEPVAVSNGLFTTVLDFGDYFGEREFALELRVRPYGSTNGYSVLSPPQPLRTSPLAISANHANMAVSVLTVPESALPPSVLRLDGSNSFTGQVNFSNPANVYSGSFSGNGAGLEQVSASSMTLPRRTVFGWGFNNEGQATIPAAATNAVAVAAGWRHSLALRPDGTVIGWGGNSHGQITVPVTATNAIAVSAGAGHSMALKADGTVLCWGDSTWGQTSVPPDATNVVAISAGALYSVALRADGTVVAWGLSSRTAVPASVTNIVAIETGDYLTLALKADGTVVAWGVNLVPIPEGATNVVAIAAGINHYLALRSDGVVLGWGDNASGQITIPAGAHGAVAIAAAEGFSLALKSNGTIIGWGLNASGETTPPAGATNVTAISANYNHTLALSEHTIPFLSPGAIQDSSLSGNVALRSGGNAFTGNQTITSGSLGVGTVSPSAQLDVSGGGLDSFPQARLNQTSVGDYSRLRFTVGGDYSKRWDLACRSNNFVLYSGQFDANMLQLDSAGLTVRGTFVSSSDREAKENIATANSQSVLEKVLALPISTWNYKADAGTPHIGPMAQDFHAAFGVGPDNKHITTVDADGVALAAIQGLNEKVESGKHKAEIEINRLRDENAELKARLEKLEQLLNHKLKGGGK